VGWLLPRVVGEARVSVAMIAPYECLNIDATAGGEGAARERRASGYNSGSSRLVAGSAFVRPILG